MRRIVFSVLITLLLTPPAVLHAQNQWEQQVHDRMIRRQTLLHDSGFVRLGRMQMANIDAGDSHTFDLDLVAGQAYVIIGACDDDCGDLNLEIRDGNGQVVGQDTQNDAIPVVQVRPQQSGRYTAVARMSRCGTASCVTGVATYGPTTGDLGAGDEQLDAGEYYDVFSFEGVPGQSVTVDLRWLPRRFPRRRYPEQACGHRR